MKQLITTILFIISLSAFSQSVSPIQYSTNYNDILNDIIIIDDTIHLLGHQQDLVNGVYNLRTVDLTLLNNSINCINFIDTFGTDNYYNLNIKYKGKIITLGIKDYYGYFHSRTPLISVWERDSNLNDFNQFVDTLPDNDIKYLAFFDNYKVKDSIVHAFLLKTSSSDIRSMYWFKYNMENNSIKFGQMADTFYISDINISDNNDYTLLVTGYDHIYDDRVRVVKLDSTYNLLSVDSFNFEFYYNSSYIKFNQNKYVISGTAFYYGGINSYESLTLGFTDKNFNNIQLIKQFPVYSNSTMLNNRLIQDSNRNIFAVTVLLRQTLNDTAGVFVLKLDSNLNLIYRRIIPSLFVNSYIEVTKIKSNNKGGVYVLFRENDFNNPNNLGYDSYFAEIDSIGNIVTIKELEKLNNSLIISPNPAKDYFNFSIVNSEQIIKSYQIFNIQGKLINSEEFKQNRIDVSRLPIGVYVLEVIFNDGQYISKKFIKN